MVDVSIKLVVENKDTLQEWLDKVEMQLDRILDKMEYIRKAMYT